MVAVSGCWALPTISSNRGNRRRRSGFCCKAESLNPHVNGEELNSKTNSGNGRKKKVVVVGSGWAALGAAHHLCKQGFNVTVLDAGDGIDTPDNVGIQGFWYPYQNIFSLVDELELKPFTNWMTSAQYSGEGLQVEFPVYQDLPQLPTLLGTLFYTQFAQLSWVDRLTILPLLTAVIDFDNTDISWRKYDSMTARELFKQFGCSERLYQNVVAPLLQVGLYAPAEQCSAAATLAILYFLILAHQKHFDVVFCRGTIRDKIFVPWMDVLKTQGCTILEHKKMTDLGFNSNTGCINQVVCDTETYDADAVILAVGISALQELIQGSAALSTREEFLRVLQLAGVDVLTVKLKLDRKVVIPNASNVCSGLDDLLGWTFFDLSKIHDEHKTDEATVVEADFYHANELLPLKEDILVERVMSYLSYCINDFEGAKVLDTEIQRFPNSLTHFFPGSYKYMMRSSTSFPNLFMAGDWIVNRHGSWLQEKSYVTGLEAANRVVDHLEEGSFGRIIPMEEDEPHIEALRSLNRRISEFRTQLPFYDYFLQ